jgi:hypothetical protein
MYCPCLFHLDIYFTINLDLRMAIPRPFHENPVCSLVRWASSPWILFKYLGCTVGIKDDSRIYTGSVNKTSGDDQRQSLEFPRPLVILWQLSITVLRFSHHIVLFPISESNV